MNPEFIKAVEPAIKWLNENCHPHTMILIDGTRAELLEGQMTHRTEEFIKD